MTTTLKDFLEVYKPKSPDEQKFVDKHVVVKYKDRNGNDDDVFNAKNIKPVKRKEERHGYEPGDDEKVYEEVEGLDEAGNELMSLKNRIASNQKKMRAIPGIHPDKKRLAIQIEKDKKRHNELFNRMMGKNEEVDIDTVLDEALDLLMSIDEKTLTPAEMTKREEVVKAIKRGNPKMDKSMAYAIATKTAKRVAEEADLDEAVDPSKISGSRLANQLIGADDISKNKDGSHTIRRGFYYASGTSAGHADKISKGLNELGIKHDVVDHGTHDFRRFKGGASVRTQNHHWVTVKIHPGQKIKLDESISEASDPWAFDRRQKALAAKRAEKEAERSAQKASTKNAAASRSLDIAQAVERHVGNNYPDTDGWDDVVSHLKRKHGIGEYHAQQHIDSAVKKHLGAKNFYDYVDEFHKAAREHQRESVDEAYEDDDGWYTHHELYGKIPKESWKAGWRYNNLKNKPFYHQPTKTWHTSVKANVAEALEPWMGKNIDKPAYLRRKEHEDNKRDANPPKALRRIKEDRESAEHNLRQLNKHKRLGIVHPGLGRKVTGADISKAMREVDQHKMVDIKALLAKEERIDELSKKTLGSYISKAGADAWNTGFNSGNSQLKRAEVGKIPPEEAKDRGTKFFKNVKKGGNRLAGIDRAVNKLTKEDIINRAVDKYVPEDMKYTPEERLLKRIDSLTEAHIYTLLALFETLTYENQNKMIEIVETHEGINEILNFALENRGE